MTSGQWMRNHRGTSWFFETGSLALDFAYTGDFGYGVAAWERLHTPVDLDVWIRERFGAPVAATTADFDAARRLRTAITTLAIAAADDSSPNADAIDAVNLTARLPAPAPQLPGGRLEPEPLTVTAALSSVARDAVTVLGEPLRLRRCAAEDCGLVFYDTSRPNARRWCSMRNCGNRAKLRAHRNRSD